MCVLVQSSCLRHTRRRRFVSAWHPLVFAAVVVGASLPLGKPQSLPSSSLSLSLAETYDGHVPRLYSALGHYLCEVYVIEPGSKNAGHNLMPDPMIAYLRQFMHMCHNYLVENLKCEHKHELFFTCLDENAKTADRKWFDKVAKNLVYASFKHHAEAGVYLCSSPPPSSLPPPLLPYFALSLTPFPPCRRHAFQLFSYRCVCRRHRIVNGSLRKRRVSRGHLPEVIHHLDQELGWKII